MPCVGLGGKDGVCTGEYGLGIDPPLVICGFGWGLKVAGVTGVLNFSAPDCAALDNPEDVKGAPREAVVVGLTPVGFFFVGSIDAPKDDSAPMGFVRALNVEVRRVMIIF